MMTARVRRTTGVVAAIAATGLALAGCSSGTDDGDVELTFLVDAGERSVATAETFADAFEEENPDITVQIDTKPSGTEGDNLVKTRLSTGEMADLFLYNSG